MIRGTQVEARYVNGRQDVVGVGHMSYFWDHFYHRPGQVAGYTWFASPRGFAFKNPTYQHAQAVMIPVSAGRFLGTRVRLGYRYWHYSQASSELVQRSRGVRVVL